MENTSYISNMSYNIEVWLDEGKSLSKIKELIKKEQNKGEFPPNLELVDAYFDNENGISGSAFVDIYTGETIVGFAGTNWRGDIHEGVKDVMTDAKLGVTGLGASSGHIKNLNAFMKRLEDNGYKITQTTGHSLGGALATYAAINFDLPSVVTYNSAPLSYLLLGDAKEINVKADNYKGDSYRFVSSEDFLNKMCEQGKYIGEEFFILNGEGHGILEFLQNNEQKYIVDTLLLKKIQESVQDKVDFNNDGKIDLELSKKDLEINSLWGERIWNNSADGTRKIEIDPEDFYTLKNNLITEVVNCDIAWIKSAIVKCKEKNNSTRLRGKFF